MKTDVATIKPVPKLLEGEVISDKLYGMLVSMQKHIDRLNSYGIERREYHE